MPETLFKFYYTSGLYVNVDSLNALKLEVQIVVRITNKRSIERSL